MATDIRSERPTHVPTDHPAEAPSDFVAPGKSVSLDADCADLVVPPQASLGHKIMIATAVFAPLVGCGVACVWLWQAGGLGWLYLSLLVGGWMLTGLGITIGFHRMLTHRAFAANRVVRAFWMIAGTLAVEGSPPVWCATHRRHHQHSDKEGDPHSPHLHGSGFWNRLRGFLHAHTWWLFNNYGAHPGLMKYVPDLETDRLARFIDRTYSYWVLLSLTLPAIIAGLVTMTWTGALLGFLWGGLVRVFITHHVTWSINSVCHVFGRQDYESNDSSRNNVVFGILGHGEGWHNNHHAFPTSARHGLKWWQFDLSWLIIRSMQLFGLAWDVRLPSPRSLESKRLS